MGVWYRIWLIIQILLHLWYTALVVVVEGYILLYRLDVIRGLMPAPGEADIFHTRELIILALAIIPAIAAFLDYQRDKRELRRLWSKLFK